MRYLVSLILTCSCPVMFYGQNLKEQSFKQAIKKVVKALTERDSATLTGWTDPKTGVYILYRLGVRDTYLHVESPGFSDLAYPHAPFYDRVKLSKLQYAPLPVFNCDYWTRSGTFTDITRTSHLLSRIAKQLNRETKGTVPDSEIREIYNLEKKSRRIVITGTGGNELIFYLAYIKRRWVLTIIDKVTCDCSA